MFVWYSFEYSLHIFMMFVSASVQVPHVLTHISTLKKQYSFLCNFLLMNKWEISYFKDRYTGTYKFQHTCYKYVISSFGVCESFLTKDVLLLCFLTISNKKYSLFLIVIIIFFKINIWFVSNILYSRTCSRLK